MPLSGGVEFTRGGYMYHRFESSGTLTHWGPSIDVNYAVVAGGGGGGRASSNAAGGGGAGGMRTGTTTISASQTVTVGAGGAGAASSAVRGSNGSASSLGSISSTVGGGGGGSTSQPGGAVGGSGGGSLTGTAGGAGTAGEGTAGGTGSSGGQAGGGGGAGAAGANGAGGVGGGTTVTTEFYFAGGGGANFGGTTRGGGGRGASTTVAATNGLANSGGGGGGARSESGVQVPGNGGSGVVLVWYPLFPGATYSAFYGDASDGYILSSNATYLTARSGGTFTVNTVTAGFGASTLQQLNAGVYNLYEGFVGFDTSSIPDNDVIVGVHLDFTIAGWSGGPHVAEAYYYDWGASLTSVDWVPGGILDSLTKVGTYPSSDLSLTTGRCVFTEQGLNLRNAINRTGTTRLLLATDLLRTSVAPTATDQFGFNAADVGGTDLDPRLVIIHHPPRGRGTGVHSQAVNRSAVI